jgi:undecaprenyl-diphosphatase
MVIIFGLLAHEIVAEKEDWFDSKVFLFFKQNSIPETIQFFHFITFLGSTPFLLVVYSVVIVYLLVNRRKEDALDVSLLGISSWILLVILKNYFARHRPEAPLFKALTNYSFPSGHALSSFILCCVLITLVQKSDWSRSWKIGLSISLVILSVLIGISRIVLRYHFASDVVAGFCAGFAWVMLSRFLFNRFKFFK